MKQEGEYQLEAMIEASGGTPHEVFYQELCDEWGPEIVDYVQRSFYLRMWKQVHGEYPCELDYVRLRSLMAIEEEQNLKQNYEMHVSHMQNKHASRQTTQRSFPGGGVTPNVHRNVF